MDIHLVQAAVGQFLGREAMLLDEGRFDAWLDLLAEDIVYEAPVRLGANTRDEETAAGGYRFRDTKDVLRLRVARLSTRAGFAEMPPSRTVRSVSSLCIVAQEGDEVAVSSALIVYRQRGNDAWADTIHARRTDRLRLTDAGPLLCARSISLPEISLSTPNLGIFL